MYPFHRFHFNKKSKRLRLNKKRIRIRISVRVSNYICRAVHGFLLMVVFLSVGELNKREWCRYLSETLMGRSSKGRLLAHHLLILGLGESTVRSLSKALLTRGTYYLLIISSIFLGDKFMPIMVS